MTSQPLEPRVPRLENDVTAIYEILGEMQVKLNEHDARFDGIDTRLDGIAGRLDGIDGRLDGLSAQMTEVLELVRAR